MDTLYYGVKKRTDNSQSDVAVLFLFPLPTGTEHCASGIQQDFPLAV